MVCYDSHVHRPFPLLLGSLLLLLPDLASTAEHTSAPDLLEPPEEQEEWQGSVGALWMHYPLNCAVWGNEEKRTLQCKHQDNTIDLTIHRSQANPLLHAQGMILGKAIDARAVKKGDILDISGIYGDQTSSLPLTIRGTAQDFTFSGTYDNTPFQGNGSYTSDSLHVSLSFTKTFPITGILDLQRSDDAVEFLPITETGTASTGTGMIPTTLPLLSSGTIEGATQLVIDHVQDTGQALMSFSRILTLVFQALFAVLAVLVLITFGFLLHRLKNQHMSSPQNPPREDHAPPHHGNV